MGGDGYLRVRRSRSPSVQRGLRYLLGSQKPDGSWDEEQITGTGFPNVFYLKYDMYRQNFPLRLTNAPDSYYGGFAWYELEGDSDAGIKRSRAMLFELLDQTRDKICPSEKTTVFGFSQGCLLAIELGARYPHQLAGIVGVSGYVHEPERLVREFSPQATHQRFLITHGTHDPLIPYRRAAAANGNPPPGRPQN